MTDETTTPEMGTRYSPPQAWLEMPPEQPPPEPEAPVEDPFVTADRVNWHTWPTFNPPDEWDWNAWHEAWTMLKFNGRKMRRPGGDNRPLNIIEPFERSKVHRVLRANGRDELFSNYRTNTKRALKRLGWRDCDATALSWCIAVHVYFNPDGLIRKTPIGDALPAIYKKQRRQMAPAYPRLVAARDGGTTEQNHEEPAMVDQGALKEAFAKIPGSNAFPPDIAWVANHPRMCIPLPPDTTIVIGPDDYAGCPSGVAAGLLGHYVNRRAEFFEVVMRILMKKPQADAKDDADEDGGQGSYLDALT